jgi:hypothetical protein
MRPSSKAILKLTYIRAISGGIDSELVAMGIADVKEADIEYLFLTGVGGWKTAGERRGHI